MTERLSWRAVIDPLSSLQPADDDLLDQAEDKPAIADFHRYGVGLNCISGRFAS